MFWLYAAIAAYLFFAISSIADRYLLAGPLPHPRLYAFYAGVTGAFATVLVPFGFHIPSAEVIFYALIAGASGIGSLYLFYRAIFHGRISTTVPGVGAMTPIFTLIFSLLIFREEILISLSGFIALVLLIVGAFFLSMRVGEHRLIFAYKNLLNMAAAAAGFGFAFTMTKLVFSNEEFINGFIWMAWGGFLFSFFFLLGPGTRNRALHKNFLGHFNVGIPFLASKGAGALGSLLQNYAIYLATVTQVAFISALTGVQYFFLLFLVVIFALRNPKLLKEELNRKSIPLRIMGTLSIILGLFLLVS